MGTLFIAAFVCPLAACVIGVGTTAWLGYRRVRAGFNIGRWGFYIEADVDADPGHGPFRTRGIMDAATRSRRT